MAYKIYYHAYWGDEEFITHMRVDKVSKVLKDIPAKDKIGYDTWDTTLYRETKKDVFYEFYKLEQQQNFSDYTPNGDKETTLETIELIREFKHPDTMKLYPELFI